MSDFPIRPAPKLAGDDTSGETRKPERYTKRRSLAGFYPRCQHFGPNDQQCNRSTYENYLCFQHYQESLEDRDAND